MGTLLILQQSCFTWHGIQLKIQSHVLLQIACICIMHKKSPVQGWDGIVFASLTFLGWSSRRREREKLRLYLQTHDNL